jgi:uncharacterized protein (DUF488 family)
MTLYTIGCTRQPAERFFTTLIRAGVRRLVDVRLRNTSQLAGFAKRDDLAYLLRVVGGIAYQHEPLLAPSQPILAAYRATADWDVYREQFLALLRDRRVATCLDRDAYEAPTVLLCSEPCPERCHRSLVTEHLSHVWGGLYTVHL